MTSYGLIFLLYVALCYTKWKRDIKLTRGLINLDLASIEHKPDTPDANRSVADKVKFDK